MVMLGVVSFCPLQLLLGDANTVFTQISLTNTHVLELSDGARTGLLESRTHMGYKILLLRFGTRKSELLCTFGVRGDKRAFADQLQRFP